MKSEVMILVILFYLQDIQYEFAHYLYSVITEFIITYKY